MYSNTPSIPQTRRPWSPDLPGSFPTPTFNQLGRREPSNVSVEALDLADYARILQRNPNGTQLHFHPYDSYPPSPPSSRPFSLESLQPPSLVSRGGTMSTTSSSRSPSRRPFSLPPPSSLSHSHGFGHAPRIAQDDDYDYPHEPSQHGQESEVDIARFPAFSRHWYKTDKPQTQSPLNVYHSDLSHEGISPFDPLYKHSSEGIGLSDFDLPLSSSNSRSMLPWANEVQDQSIGHIDGEIKQERLHLLEREFGGTRKPAEIDVDHAIGSVDQHGKLITDGPRKRLAVRCLQAITTLGAAISILYAALAIKPAIPPPPQGKLPLYILYVLSIINFFAIVYLTLIYPNCCLGRRKPSNLTDPTSGPNGLMVLPVQQLPGGNKYKGDKKQGKKGKNGGDVQVNLIVDPTIFRGRGTDGDDEERWISGSHSGGSTGGAERRSPKRMSVFVGLAMEQRWKIARKLLKWTMVFDICCCFLWGIEFVLILMGQRCSPGQFQGWCDSYNFATALTCMTFFIFGLSVFFDIKDLHKSKASPRTRT